MLTCLVINGLVLYTTVTPKEVPCYQVAYQQ